MTWIGPGKSASIMDHLPHFVQTQYAESPEDFLEKVCSFDCFGRKTELHETDGINYLVNQFWTSGQRKSHSIHEISYRACFKAQLPEFFIDRLTRPGGVVYDPFMGRGTTPVQAALVGRRAYGNDVNPLSVLLARPRLNPIDFQDILDALKTVPWSRGKIEREDLLVFYHPGTLQKLEALRAWLADRVPLGEDNDDFVADWIRMIAINRLSGHSPGFFSGRSMPPNQAVSIKSQIRINERLGVTPPERDVAHIIAKKTVSLLRDGSIPRSTGYCLLTGSAWRTPEIPDGSVDLVVTSPPFLDIVNYAADNWLRCWFAGIDPNSVEIGMHRSEEAWMQMVALVLEELARVLRRGGYIAFEVGEVRNGTVLLERQVWRAASGLPFRRLGVIVNDQEFTKTANCWGVINGVKGTNTNRIVLLQRI